MLRGEVGAAGASCGGVQHGEMWKAFHPPSSIASRMFLNGATAGAAGCVARWRRGEVGQ